MITVFPPFLTEYLGYIVLNTMWESLKLENTF